MTKKAIYSTLIVLMFMFTSCSFVCEKARWIPVCEPELSLEIEKIQMIEVDYYKVRKQVISDIPMERIEEYYNLEFLNLGKAINILVAEAKEMNEDNPNYGEWKDNIARVGAWMQKLKNEYLLESGGGVLEKGPITEQPVIDATQPPPDPVKPDKDPIEPPYDGGPQPQPWPPETT